MPARTRGKRIIVALMDGELAISSTCPDGWISETARWTLTGAWHDVDQWKPA